MVISKYISIIDKNLVVQVKKNVEITIPFAFYEKEEHNKTYAFYRGAPSAIARVLIFDKNRSSVSIQYKNRCYIIVQ